MTIAPLLTQIDNLMRANKPVKAMMLAADVVDGVTTPWEAEATLTRLDVLHERLQGTGREDYVDQLRERVRLALPELVLEERFRFKTLEERLVRLARLSTEPSDEKDIGRSVRAVFGDDKDLFKDSYATGRNACAGLGMSHLRDHRNEMVRTLKRVAVERLTNGFAVEGLATDSVPLVAYALSEGQLPLGAADDPARAEEQANDALLTHADAISRVPSAKRSAVLWLFRLAFVIGLADAYAEEFGLAELAP